jgi:hypothetical protein
MPDSPLACGLTPDASALAPKSGEPFQRHQVGDWGDLGEEDWKENDAALHAGLRLLSVYRSASGVTFWIITEADGSATVLLPEDD